VLMVHGSPDDGGHLAPSFAAQRTGLAKDNTDITAELQVDSFFHWIEYGSTSASLQIS
jgi:hypothetical protein